MNGMNEMNWMNEMNEYSVSVIGFNLNREGSIFLVEDSGMFYRYMIRKDNSLVELEVYDYEGNVLRDSYAPDDEEDIEIDEAYIETIKNEVSGMNISVGKIRDADFNVRFLVECDHGYLVDINVNEIPVEIDIFSGNVTFTKGYDAVVEGIKFSQKFKYHVDVIDLIESIQRENVDNKNSNMLNVKNGVDLYEKFDTCYELRKFVEANAKVIYVDEI